MVFLLYRDFRRSFLNNVSTKKFYDEEEYYHKLGLKCGLEVHQQLATEQKLFCRCKAVLHRDNPTAEILRHMRPTLSELGLYDGTALMEFKTKKNVIYKLYDDTVCTYEMDDTPPFPLNQQALDIALEIGMLLNCSIVDEIHISRKQYLDGSIPTGFQRTGIIGIEGEIPYRNRKIRIIQLGLEEDACREISDKGHEIVFKTDRLSIPLVEVVTYPDIRTPKEAAEVAAIIGRLLRSTGKVRRGLGSVRQDINVSIHGSTRVELKGVTKLQYISKAVSNEVGRQKALLEIRDELRLRGINEQTFQSESKDVTWIFNDTECKQLKEIIKNKGKIYGIVLRFFAGVLERPTQPGKTFNDELSGRVRVIACLDIMPNIIYNKHFEEFGITAKEINQLEKLFNIRSQDTLVLVWANEADVKTAVEEIRIRAIEATNGVPSETRQVFSDGFNDFERILPGPDRMYPDTDSPPTPINEERLERIGKIIPERLWDREKRLKKMGLSDQLVASLAISQHFNLFDKIVKDLHVDPILVAVTLEQTLKYLQRCGKKIRSVSNEKMYQLFKILKEKKISREAISVILDFLSDNPNKGVEQAIHELDIKPMSIKELENALNEIITQYKKPKNVMPRFGVIMGKIMKVARNRIDGRVVKDMVVIKLNG